MAHPYYSRLPLTQTETEGKRGPSDAAVIELPIRRLERWNFDTEAYEVPSGEYKVRMGSSAGDIRLKDSLTIQK